LAGLLTVDGPRLARSVNGCAVLRSASALRVTDRARRGKGLTVRFGEDCGRSAAALTKATASDPPERRRAVKAGAATASGGAQRP